MARIVPVGPPVNEAERRTIAALRDGLPQNYVVIHNFEIKIGSQVYEIDLAVLTPHGVYLVDSKGTRGQIDVYGSKWYPQGRAAYHSPLAKLRDHAKALKSLLVDQNPNKGVDKVYVSAVVVLTADDAVLTDSSGKDGPNTVKLSQAVKYFQSPSTIPRDYTRSFGPLFSVIESTIIGKAKPPSRPEQYRDWIITEKLGGTALYQEYRARHAFSSGKGLGSILRVYAADPYLPEADRTAQKRRISNAYEALSRLPTHPGVVPAREFFPTEDEDRFILVLEDVLGGALRRHFNNPSLGLTFDQRVRIARDLLAALAHAHRFGVTHRNLNPGCVLVGADGGAKITGFDFARAGDARSQTIAGVIADDLEREYEPPDLLGAVGGTPAQASPASDVFSLGLILYELFVGSRPFATPEAMIEQNAVLPPAPGDQGSPLAKIVAWLQGLCGFTPEQRPTAAAAAEGFERIFAPPEGPPLDSTAPSQPSPESSTPPDRDYKNLPPGTPLGNNQYVVDEKLGSGHFGAAYRVTDTIEQVTRTLKVVIHDRHSVRERLRTELSALRQVPPHPHVARVINANQEPDGTPFLIFEYADGGDVATYLKDNSISQSDALNLGKQVAAGLVHLHAHHVHHCDVKPANLIWTPEGTVRIIDFNVSVAASGGLPGGTRRYIPPDLDPAQATSATDLADRDVYALGVTLYEAMTRGKYPFDSVEPAPATQIKDPTRYPGCADLNPELVALLQKALAPHQPDRFACAADFLAAISRIESPRRPPERPKLVTPTPLTVIPAAPGEPPPRPNTNPFDEHLQTLFSQSRRSNAGTRGLDARYGASLYVPTALDRDLLPDVLAGKLKLVVITGNAGDGKTAFLQTMERAAKEAGGSVTHKPNGSRIELNGHTYESNHDGSQDEGDRHNDDVLEEFFRPYAGSDAAGWPTAATRLIAINEGRLVDFLDHHGTVFAHLRNLVEAGLRGEAPCDGLVVVNLNLRSVVGDVNNGTPLLDHVVSRMAAREHWAACESCDLKEKCYARHNALTFQDDANGPKVIERLRHLYTLTHLRNRMHVTLRDLRSALAFTLTSGRDCDEIHQLYAAGEPGPILDGHYFNAWSGGNSPTADRLLGLLRDVDVGVATNPKLDRSLDFDAPRRAADGLSFDDRPQYDLHLLNSLFDRLPRDATQNAADRAEQHRSYVAAVRRRYFFERRDEGWRDMTPYRWASRMVRLIREPAETAAELTRIVRAINRAEGILDHSLFADLLVLQVRQVDTGLIRSYRSFPASRLRLVARGASLRPRYVEFLPSSLELEYDDGKLRGATLDLNLDVFEMLNRLGAGYYPTADERQGYYLGLTVFKNVLSSAPYQDVLLTENGQQFYRVARDSSGVLTLGAAGGEA